MLAHPVAGGERIPQRQDAEYSRPGLWSELAITAKSRGIVGPLHLAAIDRRSPESINSL